MATPLTAPYRLEFQYTVGGQLHKKHMYLDVIASSDPTGYDVVDRVSGSGIGVSVAVDQVWTLVSNLFTSASTAFGQAILQKFSAGAWLPVAIWNTTVSPAGSTAFFSCSQNTIVLRDTAFHHVKIEDLEFPTQPPQKFITLASMSGSLHGYVQALCTVQTFSSHNPWLWVRGRSNLYIDSFVSDVVTLNRRLRRRRGFA